LPAVFGVRLSAVAAPGRRLAAIAARFVVAGAPCRSGSTAARAGLIVAATPGVAALGLTALDPTGVDVAAIAVVALAKAFVFGFGECQSGQRKGCDCNGQRRAPAQS
jgi:hypothetical protein